MSLFLPLASFFIGLSCGGLSRLIELSSTGGGQFGRGIVSSRLKKKIGILDRLRQFF